MIRSKYIFFALLLILIRLDLYGQSLRGLSENPVIRKYRSDQSVHLKSAPMAEENTLPFFEDFSTSSVDPDPAKWKDKRAFINNSFPLDPISTGAATMDAIDENGFVYAVDDLPVSSDELTSWPFDLSTYASSGETITLSFYYQAGGNGETPELTDSLLLEIYSPDIGHWSKLWDAETDTATPFEQVILEIPQSYYRQGFQFRFRNYTSLSTNDVIGGKGALSNVDCWNIDYIMMNTLPSAQHQSVQDITLVYPPKYLLDLYEIVPWSHLNAAQSITRNMLHYVIRNLALKGDSVNVGRSYYMKDLQTGYTEFAEESYGKFPPNSLERRNDPFFAPFTNTGHEKEGTLEIGAYLITPAGEYKQNDTAVTTLHFKDYYAYDDGIPEYGFGISGESTYGALLAYKFRIFKPDTLQAIDIFFNRSRDNFTSGEKFQLCVWEDDDGKPGDLLYISPETFSPEFSEFLEPVRYTLQADDNLIVTDTVVYVGLKQLTEEFLNVGYDVNRNSLSRIFINLTGDWFNPGSSIKPGSLMIRPVFGGQPLITRVDELPDTGMELVVFPNPAHDLLFIQSGDEVPEQIMIFDSTGKLVCQKNDPVMPLDISSWSPGIYVVKITGKNGENETRKFIISH